MALLEEHFYHGTIRLYTSVFGTLFDNIKIVRSDGKAIKVPLSYGGQQKQNTRIDEKPDPDQALIKMRLPRLSYVLRGWEKDDQRATNKRHLLQEQKVDRTVLNGVETQLNRVPYIFNFELKARTKHIDDMLQIVEQIEVSFNPTLTVVVEDNPDLNSTSSLPITLADSSLDDQFEGLHEEGRIIEATFNFTLEGYLYMPTSSSSIIRTVIVNYKNLLNPDDLLYTDVFTEADL